ncbi:hypothetical protein CCR75_004393 [Bremia lactucae]|uniref:TRUD domain-containing protein n=1 Tax=Bremia lactucae TaxID=4779 RepID=A0A976IFE3_BRELC|nr:hypothetical protein CCR75_004393 [Bremia lactucae]
MGRSFKTRGGSNGGHRGGRGRGRGGRGRGGRERGERYDRPDFRATGYNDSVPCSVDESDVGIQCFLRPEIPGFHGSTKHRFSDFVVREVTLDGRVVTLSDVPRFTPNVKPLRITEVFKLHVLGFLHEKTTTKTSPSWIELFVNKVAGRLLGLFNANKRAMLMRQKMENIEQLQVAIARVCGTALAEKLREFVQDVIFTQEKKEKQQSSQEKSEQKNPADIETKECEMVFYFPPLEAKETRTAIHDAVRQFGKNLIVADTTKTHEGVAVIRVRPMAVNGKKRKDMDPRNESTSRPNWPTNRPEYLEFVLYKRNMETNSVMLQLAKAMNTTVSAFTYAGTKDKRGITTQRCTVYRVTKEQLATLNRSGRELDAFNFLVGNATYVPKRLHLGDSRGNRFSLAIRDLPHDEFLSTKQIQDAIRSWRDHGFINYFGLQRFGTKSIATHVIGRAILQRNYQGVVDLLLSPQEGDASLIRKARQAFQENHNIEAALQALPPYLVAERALLHGMQTHGATAYALAIQSIPRHLRMMYTHAYQSYVWNKVASERLKHLSREVPVVGDLVIPHEIITIDVVEETIVETNDEESGRMTKKPRGNTALTRGEENVILVTPENVSQYTIYDVVLPLPGYSVTYPTNAMKELYEEILKADGIDFYTLERVTNSEYHLPGSYRHVLRKPQDVAYKVKRFNDSTLPLLETDVDHLLNRPVKVSIPDGKFRALCLEFQLGPSSYATMAIRELLKQSSNLHVQLQLKQKLEEEKST